MTGMAIARMFIILGIILIAIGLIWALFAKIGFGRLPGDILIEGRHGRIFIPVTSAILVSVVLTVVVNLVLWLLNRLG